MDIYFYFGKFLKIYRKEKGVTQECMGYDLNLSRARVCDYEVGHKLSLDRAYSILVYLGKSFGDFQEYINEQELRRRNLGEGTNEK